MNGSCLFSGLFCKSPFLLYLLISIAGYPPMDDVLWRAGDVIRWEQQLRFRHLATRQYLCITTDRRVTLTADSKDPRTVFRLHPVIKV